MNRLKTIQIHQERASNKKGGGICIYVLDTLMHKVISNICASDADNETLVIEIINKK